MDPVSIIGLTAAIQQILKSVYNFTQGVRESKSEINQLCSEMLALKAALEHIQINLSLDDDSGTSKAASPFLSSPNFSTPEFKDMVSSAQAILMDLRARLEVKPSRLKTSLQRMAWPLVKDDVQRYVERLHRLTSWFVLTAISDNTVICRESYNKICSIEQLLRQQVETQERWQTAEEQRAMQEWLGPVDSYPLYRRSLEVYLNGTGTWFLDEFLQSWLHKKSAPILWLRAKPGTGKTTLLSAAIERSHAVFKAENSRQALAFFYCSFANQNTQDIRTTIASLLTQLCDTCPHLWREVDQQYRTDKGDLQKPAGGMSLEEGVSMLMRASAKTEVFLFLDALNESKDPTQMLDIVKRLVKESPSVRVMISSTQELNDPFITTEAAIIEMKQMRVRRDVQAYIEDRLKHDPRLSVLPNSLKSEIAFTLQRDNDGMFRWVQCQLDALTRKKTPKEIRLALKNVPRTLAKTYEGILIRIPEDDVATARQMLFWISSTVKPMTLRELCEAVIVEENSVVINDDVRLLNPKRTLELCSSLISYDNRSTMVTLAHSSVKDYLSSKEIRDSEVRSFYLDPAAAFQAVSTRCINYLMLPAFRSGCCQTETKLNRRFDRWPLLTYIAETLFDHLELVDLHDSAFVDLLLRFFATHHLPRGGNFGAWVQAFIPLTTFNIQSSTPLFYAARFGLVGLVRLIFKTQGKGDLEKPGGPFSSTPLHVASWAQHTEVVKELLEAGADAKEHGFDGSNGLYCAVMSGNKAIEYMLRNAGATLDEV